MSGSPEKVIERLVQELGWKGPVDYAFLGRRGPWDTLRLSREDGRSMWAHLVHRSAPRDPIVTAQAARTLAERAGVPIATLDVRWVDGSSVVFRPAPKGVGGDDLGLRDERGAAVVGRALASVVSDLRAKPAFAWGFDAESTRFLPVPDWREALGREIAHLRAVSKAVLGRLSGAEFRLFDALATLLPGLDVAPELTLVHGRLRPESLRIDLTHLREVDGWHQAFIGDPLFELGGMLDVGHPVLAPVLKVYRDDLAEPGALGRLRFGYLFATAREACWEACRNAGLTGNEGLAWRQAFRERLHNAVEREVEAVVAGQESAPEPWHPSAAGWERMAELMAVAPPLSAEDAIRLACAVILWRGEPPWDVPAARNIAARWVSRLTSRVSIENVGDPSEELAAVAMLRPEGHSGAHCAAFVVRELLEHLPAGMSPTVGGAARDWIRRLRQGPRVPSSDAMVAREALVAAAIHPAGLRPSVSVPDAPESAMSFAEAEPLGLALRLAAEDPWIPLLVEGAAALELEWMPVLLGLADVDWDQIG